MAPAGLPREVAMSYGNPVDRPMTLEDLQLWERIGEPRQVAAMVRLLYRDGIPAEAIAGSSDALTLEQVRRIVDRLET
jgi:hypothetical protein